jgi:hypothetical protein
LARRNLNSEKQVALSLEAQTELPGEVLATTERAQDAISKLEKTLSDFDAQLEVTETHVVEPGEAAAESAVEAQALMTPEERALAAAARQEAGLTARLRSWVFGTARSLEVGGNLLGAVVGGYQVGTGVENVAEGEIAQGTVDILEGSSNLALTIGTAAAIKKGLITVKAGTAASGLAAGVAASRL